jgi:hypothetical protein
MAHGHRRGHPLRRPHGRHAVPRLAGHVAARRRGLLPRRRRGDRPGRDPGRPGRGRPGLVLPHPVDADRQRRAVPGRRRRLRPAAMATPGTHRPGPDRRARRDCADHAQRRPGRRRGDQGRGAPGPANRHHPLHPDALPSGSGRHHQHRQLHSPTAVHESRAAYTLIRRQCEGTHRRVDRAAPRV